jgi:hypothetical protein
MRAKLGHPAELADRQAPRLHPQHLLGDLDHVLEVAAIQRDPRVLDQLLMSGIQGSDGNLGHTLRTKGAGFAAVNVRVRLTR